MASAAPGAKPFGEVPLSKRVSAYLERTPAGAMLDVVSSVLSLLTVITYVVETTHTTGAVWAVLALVDLVCVGG